MHRWLGIPIYSRARAAHVSTALFRRDETFFLIAVNNSDTDQDVVIDLHANLFADIPYRVCDLVSGVEGQAHLRRTGQITLRLPAKNGTVARIEPGK